ncbi:regulation of nuclear pre-mRNA domain-containing protein 1B [Punica granatum]|uniref:CID domain-containing protein n=2 Tax=Punica granatum TaxID=22663 RepID=A0A218XC03_PUNGR|nr:regulation of nuclear pre-mRNA domain-containing protein 1B [Punica granatum]OWM82246.1 hypothetical protein CDL15_Pgr001820 [Punica granatum]PKI76345.1 hypothetical protein CRG98_003267 [Punica granatum]
MNSVFSEQILADKLSKLNSTQQCIETLSHLCIFHQSKAKLVVATWEKQFHKSEMTQKVPLLYLANDILQNSKRKGNEFVMEFWKVLPAALKDVTQKGDDRGKNVVSRLVDIWEERRVFGSHAKSFRDLMLGEEAPPPLELNKKRSRSVRIVKRDSRSIRTKLSIGSTPEKVVSAFHLVLSEHPNEDLDMNNCKTAVQHVRKMENDFEIACSTAKDPKRKPLAKELEDEENTLKQCIEKLKSVEAARAALVSQLKEALHEQESQLENLRTQMQVAQAQTEEAEYMRKRLNDEDYVLNPSISNSQSNEVNAQIPKRSTASIAAEVADKLTASTSSQLIMTSILSSMAAEEAKNAGLSRSSNSFPDPGPKPDNQPVSAPAQFVATPSTHQSYQSVVGPPQQTLQTRQAQALASQPQYHHVIPTQPGPAPQYMQLPGGGMAGPYGFGNFPTMSAPHALPSPHVHGSVVPLARTAPSLTQQQPAVPLTQQPPIPLSFRPLPPSGPGGLYYSASNPSQ